MEAVYLDTHAVVWLFEGRLDLISRQAQHQINTRPLACSPLVELELQYLYEIGRKKYPASEILSELGGSIGLNLHDISTTVLVQNALHEGWTRDPFDRLIVAQAKADSATLLTADKTIQAHYNLASW